MRVARYLLGDRIHYGNLIGAELHPLAGDFPNLSPVAGAPVAVASAKLLTPTLPNKVIAIGPGQRAILRPGASSPERPKLWFKPPPGCLTNPGDPIVFPATAQGLNHEVEVALVVGQTARHVSVASAGAYIAGYTVHNDLTVGDPAKDGNSPLATYWKSFDGCSVFGPIVATHLTSKDLSSLTVRARVNGNVLIEGKCDLLYSPEDLVSWMSHMFTLYPGDVISMGCLGTGLLVPGDVVEAEVEGIGSFTNEILPSDVASDEVLETNRITAEG